ncbi:MAG TPA: pyridoxal 5'-phosphate synthase glutaminase subunit PdxT [Dehalococcoidia bacterium]|jgi:5'-phosphate synthase pdxT subunit|nr:pyridoxal 5'-phosphate synthase glutaminase subunit PdxT [Dehalococcoidia bacterium]
MSKRPLVGVLALQGDFREHATSLSEAGAEVTEIRHAENLKNIQGLIIPGGESTAIARLLIAYNLTDPIRRHIEQGLPTWGTCAGAILLAKNAPDLDRPTISVMNITVQRNAFGPQINSFEENIYVNGISGLPIKAILIRAPIISDTGPEVSILGKLSDGSIVAVKENNLLATSFHPELTNDSRMHGLFVDMTRQYS